MFPCDTQLKVSYANKYHVVRDVILKVYGFFVIYLLGFVELLRQLVWLYKLRKHHIAGPDESLYANDELILITGGLGGIGFEVVKKCVEHRNRIIILDKEPAAEAAEKIEDFKDCVKYYQVDLRDLKSVKSTCNLLIAENNIPDVMLFNAGIMHVPYELRDGIESQLLVSYLSHCLILSELHGLLKPRSRVVFTTSVCHKAAYLNLDDIHGELAYSAHLSYAQAKICQLLLTRFLSKRLHINAVHPAIIDTELYQHVWTRPVLSWLTTMTKAESALCLSYACLSAEMDEHSGCYLEFCKPATPQAKVFDERLQRKLFDRTVTMLKPYTDFSKLQS